MNQKTRFVNTLLVSLCICLLICITNGYVFGQIPTITSKTRINNLNQTIVPDRVFIENKGQYATRMPGYEDMGAIQYGYEGLDMPVLFTAKGLIHLQRKLEPLAKKDEEEFEKQGLPEEEIERKKVVTDRVITMQWVGANPDVQIIVEDKSNDYHTYGLQMEKAYGFKKITYKNIYPGVDIVYCFNNNTKAGFEYSLVAGAGTDLSLVKMRYGGDIEKIKIDGKGNLFIRSDINGITESIPVSYYGNEVLNKTSSEIETVFQLNDKDVVFSFPQGFDHSKPVVVDPFVTATSNLTGLNAGKAKDVDFDYAGNVYVTGGGDGVSSYKLAKFNAAGVLQWTFNGTLAIPAWDYGPYYGGSVVDKTTGNVYLGQGFIYPAGFRVIRISTTGLYDNYITTANGNFTENWKMYWACNGGSPQILIAGGGINSSVNFGIFTPPSTIINSLNVTGLGGAGQDIVDLVIDPANNDMYTAYASLILSPEVNNKIYKNTAPYSAASVAWNLPSGYSTLSEAANRPYLGASLVDNSANIFAVNAAYLFYWDGKNLKAFDKATGALAGTALSTANTPLMQGGIIADACNNIFVGEANGNIKVYTFNGSVFNDAAAPDITIPGFAGKSVYDLAYDEFQKLLYASGDGFVSSFDVSSYCNNNIYTLNIVPNCATASATATVSPVPPAGSTVTYVLYIGATQIATNTTGVFTGLLPITNYTIVATINFACSGVRTTGNFVLPGPAIATTLINTTCGNSIGQIDAVGSGGAAPYTYSIDGTNFFPSGTFTGLSAGSYTITVKDVNGCKNSTAVTILNTNGPIVTFTNTNATCGSNTGTVTASATGGTPPYQYSINNGVTYQSGNVFTGLVAGQYTLVIKDASGCINSSLVTITANTAPLLIAIPASATCGNNNGSITAFGSGGTAPLEYSINGNIFQPANIFTNLSPGTYTVTVRDAIGCIKTVSVTIANAAAPTVTAVATSAACGNVNGTITATGSGGVAPLQYSLDGVNFQASNIFTGLAPGTYTVTVKDASGCIKTVSVTVASTGGPIVTATSTASGCSVNDGTVTAVASGTIGTYQYSINGGITFQFSGTFTGLASGNYVVLAKDGNGCISAVAVIVSAVAGPLVTAVSTPSSCNVNDGTITATGSGTALPLQYSINGVTFQGSNIFTGLAPNTYTVTVKDANGCIKTTTVIVSNASGLTLLVSTISTSCNNINGVITATASGGLVPLQYSINGTVYQAGNVFTGIAAGNYTVYVKDANNCIVTKPATVTSVSSTVLSVTTVNATCSVANGAITASGSGGLAPLTYSINGVTYQSSGIFINVAAATYTVYVKDALGCIATQSVTITNTGTGPGISTFTITAKATYPCNGALGKLTNPRVNGANCGTCTFSLNFGPFIPNATQLYTNLSPGTYTVTAKDANGCTKTIFATIVNATLSTATAVVTGTACNTSNGSIALTGVGPNTPYHASISGIGGPWIDFDPSYTFTGLAPGTYSIILADDESFDAGPPIIPGGCLDTITVIVPSIGGPSISTTQTNGTCIDPYGSITAFGTGGTGSLQYSIDGINFQAGNVFDNLAAGDYVVTVMDDAGCSNITQVTLLSPSGPTVTAATVSTSCNLGNGSIIATGTGGTSPYEYSINGTIFQSSNTFANLAAGTYSLYIKDVQGCYSTISVTVSSTPRPAVIAYTVSASCNNNDGSIIAAGSSGIAPYQYSIDGTVYQSSNVFSGLAAGFYTIYIKDSRDCINTTGISIINISAPVISTTVTTAKCGNPNGSITVTASSGTAPYQYSIDGTNFQVSNILSGLVPGTYIVTVKDANGCISTKTVLVANVVGPHTLTVTVVNAACGLSNGSITAAAVGGTAPLQYSINGVTYQASTIFSGIAGAVYTLYVKDVNGCIKTLPVTVLNLAGPTVTAGSTAASCSLNDGTITANASGGTGALTYSKNGVTFQASNIFTGLAAGTYTITVKDTRGCTSTTSVVVSPFIVPTLTAATTDATCGNANGSITVNGAGGTAPYQYSLDGITYQPSNLFSGLVAGTYLVRVKDVNNCVGTGSVVLADSPPMNGIYTVGTGGDFSTLTAAVNAYNTQCISGPITFLLTDATYAAAETFPISINSNIYASAVKTLTIKPAPGISPVITANNPAAVIRFNGADYVTLDGSNSIGGSSRDLQVINTSTNTNSTVIWVNSVNASNGATNINIENNVLTGNGATSTLAVIMSGGSIINSGAEAANSNNTYSNNQLSKARKGIVLFGPVGNETNNIISGNIIGSVTASNKLNTSGIEISEQTNTQVLNNTVFGVSSSNLITAFGIAVAGNIDGMNIAGNRIADIKNTYTGGAGANGIFLSALGNTSGINVYNNFISDIAAYGNNLGANSGDNGYGIVINGGGGYNIYHNTVVLNTNQVLPGSPAAMNITAFVSAPASINIKNNIFGNIQTQAGSHYAIQSTASSNVFASIDYNDYYTAFGSLGFIATDRPTLSDIRTGFGSNINSINITPVYLSSTDLHIDPVNVSNGVNLGDKGTLVAITTDIDNTSRSGSTPDLGADEWIRPDYASWVGRVSTDWLVPENWETNVVPDGTTEVFIKGGFTFMPTIVTTQAVKDLNMSAPDIANTPILTLSNGTIQINGQINHSGGSIDGIAGTVEMNGTTAQAIPANIFQANALNNLVIGNNTAAGVTLAGTLDIYRSVTFSATGQKLTTGDFLTFKSTATETAWLGNMTGKTIIGAATVERYIPNHSKAWQFLSVPATGQTIKESWQEGSASPNSDPNPGYGTMITSNVPNAATHPEPGYDLFSPTPSIKIYNHTTGLYDAVSSTANPIANPKGYMLFVRGDRSVTTIAAPATSTVLRTKGQLYTPANPPAVIAVNGGSPPLSFESIGNPYASAIDLTKLTLNEAGGGVQDIFYLWDPKLTSGANSAYGLGGFQVLTRNGNTYDVTPGGGSYGATNQFLQSGQAFFVNAPFASGSVKFTEACKISSSSLVNRTDNNNAVMKQLRTNLYVIQSAAHILLDGNRIQYNRNYANGIDRMDAVKLENTGENIGIRSNGKLLAVERRALIRRTDTIFLNLGQLRIQSYEFEFVATDLRQDDLWAYLEDDYLHTSTLISLDGTTRLMFTVENVPGSYAPNRFRIVFKKPAHEDDLITHIEAKRKEDHSIAINWAVENEITIHDYIIERSKDGKNFEAIKTVSQQAKNTGKAVYAGCDFDPLPGDNFYRIAALNTNGRKQYSSVVKLVPLKFEKGIMIYPNPLTDKILQVQFNAQPLGNYYLYLVNQLGQPVYNTSIKLTSRDAIKKITLDNGIPAGTYQLNIVSSGGKNTIQQLIIQ